MGSNKNIEHYYKRGKSVPAYHDIMDSEAYRSLSAKSRCLLLELQRIEFPNRNGRIGLTVQKAASLLRVVEDTASAAFNELIDRGFIERSLDANYLRGISREWRVTFLPCNGRPPTNEWKSYKKRKPTPKK